MDYRKILYDVSEKIATITLNQPEKLNAFSDEMWQEMLHALETADNDDNVVVSIVTATGRAFCAGMDLTSLESAFDPSRLAGNPPPKTVYHYQRYLNLKKPVIAALNGHAVGVGLTMVLPLDIRIAAESAKLGFIFNRRGALPETGCAFFLPRLIGVAKAAELMLTGRLLKAREALAYGIISQVVPDDRIADASRSIAREIVDNCAPVSLALTKTMLWRFQLETDIEKIERINGQYLDWLVKQPDTREGMQSFLEKRLPEWKLRVPSDLPDFFPLS